MYMNSSRSRVENILTGKTISTKSLILFAFLLCGILFGVQMIVSYSSNGVGFPLDDSWIHQTYARSLADGKGWAFAENPPSAGSTSPLWTMALVPGFWFDGTGFFAWTILVSYLVYTTLTFVSLKLYREIAKPNFGELLIFGTILAAEWHLLWAAGSGMETLLSALGYLVVFWLISTEKPHSFSAGLVVGLLVTVRPDGITMLGPVGLVILWSILKKHLRWTAILMGLAGLLIPSLVYFWHNWSLAGSFFPNTLGAKTLEYASVLNTPIFFRIGRLIVPFITGVGFLLVPGFVIQIIETWRKRDIWSLSAILWWFGFILLYAFILPVNYQHGRYLLPLLPVFLLFGFSGTMRMLQKWRFSRFFLALALIISLGFTSLGIKTYVNDVGTINALMVKPAIWVSQNTEEEDLIAAHDIGALGFYGNRKVLDLAGLIEPKVIPIIRDENKLVNYMQQTDTKYLMVFSDWYKFTKNLIAIESFSYGQGLSQKTVEIYRLK